MATTTKPKQPREALPDHVLSEIQRKLERSKAQAEHLSAEQRARTELALRWCRAAVYGPCAVCGTMRPASEVLHDPSCLWCADCRQLHARAA